VDTPGESKGIQSVVPMLLLRREEEEEENQS
jgi:hypothetical protein